MMILYEAILRHCPRIKYLHLDDISTDTIIGLRNNWLRRQYPTMISINVIFFKEMEIFDLHSLFLHILNIPQFVFNLKILLPENISVITTYDL